MTSLQVYIQTFGCQMNEHDSQHLSQILKNNGYKIADEMIQADIILLNSCSIRSGPENKIHSYIGRLKPLKKTNPRLIIGVGGCVAQQEKEKLIKGQPLIDIVFGPDNIDKIDYLIKKAQKGEKQVAIKWHKDALERLSESSKSITPSAGKAYIAITKGCDNFCSYCIVPFTRGREISREADSIILEAKNYINQGAKELVLVGQNVNSFKTKNTNFFELLNSMSDLEGLKRLRFISPHPKDWSNSHSKLMAEKEVICNQLHLPFQAGSSRILKLMRRDHTIENYLEKIRYIKNLIPDISLSTDIIVGFPTESFEDFEKTLDVITKVEFNQIFAFKYSPRIGTRAARLKDDISQEEKEKRLAILLKLQAEITNKKIKEVRGKKEQVLINSINLKRNQAIGKTESNLTVAIDDISLLPGEIYSVKITKTNNNSVKGEILESEVNPN